MRKVILVLLALALNGCGVGQATLNLNSPSGSTSLDPNDDFSASAFDVSRWTSSCSQVTTTFQGAQGVEISYSGTSNYDCELISTYTVEGDTTYELDATINSISTDASGMEMQLIFADGTGLTFGAASDSTSGLADISFGLSGSESDVSLSDTTGAYQLQLVRTGDSYWPLVITPDGTVQSTLFTAVDMSGKGDPYVVLKTYATGSGMDINLTKWTVGEASVELR